MNPLLNKVLIYLCLGAGLFWGLRARFTGQPAGSGDVWIVLGCFALAVVFSILFRLGNRDR